MFYVLFFGGKKMKKSILFLVVIISLFCLPAVNSETPIDSEPELVTNIDTGLKMLVFEIFVENVGDETAHNVKLTDVSVEGNVIFNFQESTLWSEDLEPGGLTILDPNSMAIGFGKFSLSMTVSCDEGISSTSSVEGIIFGPIFFIP